MAEAEYWRFTAKRKIHRKITRKSDWAAFTALALMAAPSRRLRSFVPPAIDLDRFVHGSSAERLSIAAAWDRTFRDVGVCLVRNYSAALRTGLGELRAQSARFFALSPEVKALSHHDNQYGYVATGVENVGATLGSGSAPDLVESLNLAAYQDPGREWTADDAEEGCPWLKDDYISVAPRPLLQAARE
jgi:hypothetical protein